MIDFLMDKVLPVLAVWLVAMFALFLTCAVIGFCLEMIGLIK